jgi:Right handed beta helix region
MRLAITISLGGFFATLCGLGCYASASDSVPAILKSISELPADKSILELAEGNYSIGSTLRVSRPGITIRGAGIGKTVLTRDPAFTGSLVVVRAPNSSITNLTIDGKGTTNMIYLAQPGDVADTVEVKGFTHIGIAVPPSGSSCRVSNCLITGPGTPSSGIWHDTGPTDTTSSLVIDHNVVTKSGIYCTGGKITISNNQLSGNHCETRGGGGQIDVGNAFTTNTVAIITGNTIVDGGGPQAGGIEMGGGDFTITNNTVRNHGLGGIGVGHNATRAKITGNVVSNSGHYIADKNRPQCRSGIYVLYGATNLEISGNRCFDDQPNKTQTWGIILTGLPARPDPRFPAKTTEHVTISNNDLRGNIHPEGLLDESGARDKIISGNLPAKANR